MDTIGNRLKTAREKRNMKPSDVARATRIKTQYVEAIEQNEFHVLIAPIYAKGFIRLYAECVGIDPAPLVRQFNEIETAIPSEPAWQEPQPAKKFRTAKPSIGLGPRLKELTAVLKKIRLPNIGLPQMPAMKPLELSAKTWLALGILIVLCLIIIPVFVKIHLAPGNIEHLPSACRWIAEPPEPYLSIPVSKTDK